MNALHINGNDLTLEAVREVAAEGRPVLLAADAREAVDRARAVVEELVASNQLSYAITTGVGKLSDVRIAGDQIRELQVNLVRSQPVADLRHPPDRKSTRLNSSHTVISYAVFCLKKKKYKQHKDNRDAKKSD